MRIIFSHIMRNVIEKKWRSLMIVLSIAFSFMILVLNLQVSETVENTAKEFSKRSTGWSDITISSGETSEALYFSSNDIQYGNAVITKKLAVLNVNGKTLLNSGRYIRTNIVGLMYDEAERFGFVTLMKGNADGAIISSRAETEFGLSIGDTFTYLLNENEITTQISGIADCDGVFFEELGVITVVDKLTEVNKHLGSVGKINAVYIGTEDVDAATAMLTENNPHFLVTQGHIADTAFLRIGLLIGLAIIMLMSVYIIASLSKFLLAERIPVLGTFLSVGAHKTKLYSLLLLESLAYGVLGGVLGTVFSFLSVRFVSELFNEYGSLGIRSSSTISGVYLLVGFLFATALSTIVTISAIVKTQKTSIKDIILGTIHTASKTSVGQVIMGVLLFILSFAVLLFNTSSNFLLGGIAILLLIIGFVCMMPMLVSLLSSMFAWINQGLFGSVAAIGAKNLKNNRIILSNIRIVTIIMALLIGVFTIILSSQANGDKLRQGQSYDLSIANLDKELYKYDAVAQLPELQDIYYRYGEFTRFTKDGETITFMLQAIDPDEKIKQFAPGIVYDSSIVEALNSGKNILIDEYRAGLYGIKVGDELILSDNASVRPDTKYTVIGFLDSKGYTGDRSIALVSEASFRQDRKERPTDILLKANGDIEKLKNSLSNQLADTTSTIYTQEEELMASYTLLGKTILLLEIVLVLGVLMGLLGMANNLYVGFLQRKSELAILYSVGLDLQKLKTMLIFEQLAVFGTATALGTILGALFVKMLPSLLSAVGLAIDFTIPIGFTAVVILGIFLLLMLSAVFPIRKIAKMNVVEELKYE